MAIQDQTSGVPSPNGNSIETCQLKKPVGIIVSLAIIHGLILAGVVWMLVKIVPSFEKIFEDFGTELPAMSIWVLNLSHFFHVYWYLSVPIILIFYVGELAVTYLLFCQPGKIALKVLWNIIILLIPLFLIIFIAVAMWAPLISLIEDLS